MLWYVNSVMRCLLVIVEELTYLFFLAVKTPEEVLHRYKEILKTFQKTKTFGGSCRKHDVDRATIQLTAAIAEVKIVCVNTKIPEYTGQTLKEYNKMCRDFIDTEPGLKDLIEKQKKDGQLLPIAYK